MAPPETGRVALFSIKPTYAEAILNGTKQVEFRRKGLARDVSHVVIYATAPVQRVVGYFDIAGIDRSSPTGLWRRHRAVGGIDWQAYDRYFDGCAEGFAIKVGTCSRLMPPLPLASLDPSLRPPQSFQYLDAAVARRLLVGSAGLAPMPIARKFTERVVTFGLRLSNVVHPQVADGGRAS